MYQRHSVKILFLLLLFGLVLFCSAGCGGNNKSAPKAVKGALDLSSWDFEKDGLIELNGQWEFYWNKIIKPEEFQAAEKYSKAQIHYFNLPSQWNGIKNAEQNNVALNNLPPYGYATYRLKVTLPHNNSNRTRLLTLKLQDIHSSYRVWVNGRFLLEKGRFSLNPSDCRPALGRELITLEQDTSHLDIVIHTANFFDYNEAGIDEEILLGTERSIIMESQQKNFFYLVSFGILIIMCLYHFLLFVIRRKEKEYLLFSIICFLLSVQTICEGDKYIFYLLPGLSASLYLKLWLASLSVVGVLIRFYYRFYPAELNKKAVNFFVGMFIFQVLFLFLFPIDCFMPFIYPTFYFTLAGVLYLLSGLFMALIRKRKHSVIVFAGMLLPLIAGINDLLYGLAWIYTGYYGSVGFVLLIFSQSYFLSLRYTESFREVENLSRELERSNRLLDKKVEERTLELKTANAELSKAIAVKNKLFSIIAHDMKNLFQAMLGYSDLIMMRTGKDEVSEIIEDAAVIKDTATKAHSLMENLLEWSMAETGKIQLKKEMLNLKDIINENIGLLNVYSRTKQVPLLAQVSDGLMICADKRMLNTILRNLISNAIKYSPAGASVKICAEQCSDGSGEGISISVTDEGTGMDKNKLESLFSNETVQSTPGTNKEKGTGLGLLLVKEFVNRHNGSIAVTSQIGKGSSFRIYLPSHF